MNMQIFLFYLILTLYNNRINYLKITLLLLYFALLNILNSFKLIKVSHLVRKDSMFIIGIENTIVFSA